MSDIKLPPLPKAYKVHNPSNSEPIPLFTVKQLLAYARQCVLADRDARGQAVAYAVTRGNGEIAWFNTGCILWPTKEQALQASSTQLGSGSVLPLYAAPTPPTSAADADNWRNACQAAVSHLDYPTDAPKRVDAALRNLRDALVNAPNKSHGARWQWLRNMASGPDFDNLSIRLPEQMDAYADAAIAASGKESGDE